MEFKGKINWAANTMLLTGVIGILYFTRMLHWHEKLLLYSCILQTIHGLSFYTKDPESRKNIRIFFSIFIIVAVLFIGLNELLR